MRRKRLAMNHQNERLGKISIVEDEHSVDGNGAGGNAVDQNNPILQPPKDPEVKRGKPWQRKLITWSVILLLSAAGVGALYLVMRTKRVSIIVNADSRKNTQKTKPDRKSTRLNSS